MADLAFNQSGAFNINEQWATAVRYEATLDGGSLSSATVKFLNGRKQVASAKVESRADAVELLGGKNVENIEAGKGKEKGATEALAMGKLQGEDLSFMETFTADKKPMNEIEAGTERDTSLDQELLAYVARRREELNTQRLQQRQNERIVASEERGDAGAGDKITPPLDRHGAKDAGQEQTAPAAVRSDRAAGKAAAEDRAKAVPDSVKSRFIQVDNKFHFPDKTLAFEDRGRKLATRSENQEVVRSVVAIAEARGWERITVRGSEDFRRAAWLEASLKGIEVSGYKPTKVEKAHLASLIERGAGRENSIEESDPRERRVASPERVQEPEQSKRTLTPPLAPEAAVAAPGERAATPLTLRAGVTAGKLLEHGAARYQNDPKKEMSYFAKVETDRGERIVWGKDLGRAIEESGVAIGDRVAMEKVGSKPVTATERVFNEKGQEVGSRPVDTHLNRWQVGSLAKAEAFANQDRAEVVKKHPDLAPSYGTVAAAQKFAEKQFPANKEDQARFVAIARQVVAEKIAHGENVPAPKIRETRVQERPKDQGKDQERAEPPQKAQEANRDVARCPAGPCPTCRCHPRPALSDGFCRRASRGTACRQCSVWPVVVGERPGCA